MARSQGRRLPSLGVGAWLLSAALLGCSPSEPGAVFGDDDDDDGAGGVGLAGNGGGISTGGQNAGGQNAGGAGANDPAGGAGGVPSTLTPACDAPAVPPSNGACIAALSDDVACNPVTNAPCSEVCGNYGPGLFQCYTVTSQEPLCASCDDLICAGGYACPDDEDWPGGSSCAKYCCDDSDCGSGTCFKDGISTPAAPVGICLQ